MGTVKPIVIETPDHEDENVLPDGVSIAGLAYTITHRKIDGYWYKHDDYGLVIEVDNKGSIERRVQTTFGGIVWAALYEWGMQSGNPDEVLNKHMLKLLYQLVRDNDFSWIREADGSLVDKLYIGGTTYTVERRKQDGVHGTCDYLETLITLNTSGNKARQVKCLVHEIMHAWLYEIGYSGHNDEKVVTRLEVNLHNLFRENDFSWVRPPMLEAGELVKTETPTKVEGGRRVA